MLRVKIYRMQAKPEMIGELRFDGKRVRTAKAKDEQDKKLLKRLLRRRTFSGRAKQSLR